MTDPQHTPAETPCGKCGSYGHFTHNHPQHTPAELADLKAALVADDLDGAENGELIALINTIEALSRQVNTLTEALRSVQNEWGCVVGCKPNKHSPACHIVRRALAEPEQLSMPRNPHQTTEIPY